MIAETMQTIVIGFIYALLIIENNSENYSQNKCFVD